MKSCILPIPLRNAINFILHCLSHSSSMPQHDNLILNLSVMNTKWFLPSVRLTVIFNSFFTHHNLIGRIVVNRNVPFSHKRLTPAPQLHSAQIEHFCVPHIAWVCASQEVAIVATCLAITHFPTILHTLVRRKGSAKQWVAFLWTHSTKTNVMEMKITPIATR